MPRRDRPSIPIELHRIRAQQIYERRVALGLEGTSEDDWEQARKELEERFWVVRDWRIQKAIEKKLQQFRAFNRRLWQSFKALSKGIWKVLTLPFWLLTKLPQQFANSDTRPFALDVVKTLISAASLIAAVAAAIGLYFSYQDARLDRQLTEERLITDRFTKAVEQIGKKDQEEVVIGGIYSLERIAKDSPKDQWTIMEVLTAFVRKNSPIPAEIKKLDDQSEEKIKALEQLEPVNIKVQAALTVIGRLNLDQDNTQEDESTKTIDLSESNLRDANLRDAILCDANLNGAILFDADLRNAKLNDADLEDADLREANLRDADLYLANLRSADLREANLRSADLREANLRNANLNNANLRNANLNNANLILADLREAKFYLANLEDADLRTAKLNDAKLREANLRNADLSNANLNKAWFYLAKLNDADLQYADLRETDLNNANLNNANLYRADLREAKLREAKLREANLYRANLGGTQDLSNTQIKSACFWEEAIYTDADWNEKEYKWVVKDEQANQQKIEEIRQDKASAPENPPDCAIWER